MKRLLISATLAVAVLVLPGIGGNNVPSASALSFVVTNLNDSGPGSLRDAINSTNANPGPDTITFSVSGVINLNTTPLNLTDPGTTIDGSGQNITVDGSSLSWPCNVFIVWASSATFKGFTTKNSTCGYPAPGIFVGGDASGNVNGLTVQNMTIHALGGNGILVRATNVSAVSITGSTIEGGLEATAISIWGIQNRDISISNNESLIGDWNAVEIGAGFPNFKTTENTNISISGNTSIKAMSGGGIYVVARNSDSSFNSNIEIKHNKSIFAGAIFPAVEFDSPNNRNITVDSNTSLAGTSDGVFVGKWGGRVWLSNNSTVAITNNKSVAGNNGVTVRGINSNVTVSGNESVKATASGDGIAIGHANGSNTSVLVSRNTITGGARGVRIAGSVLGSKNEISNNTIHQNGTGIELSDTYFTVSTNTIRDNSGSGVVVLSGTGDWITRNSIYANGGLGIDLGGDGMTPNDPGDVDTGPNNLQNYPVLTAAASFGGNTVIAGNLSSTPNTTFRLEFFSNPAGTGQGKTFIGSATAATDASGNANFVVNFPVTVPAGNTVTSTATDPGNNTSEFSQPITPPVSTAGCKVTYGGNITAANGDKATFGGNAQVPLKGEEQYTDHGPATPMDVHSINVLAVICGADGKQASIFGQATINNAGSYVYRIDLKDLGEPGTRDTYRIVLSNGYDSGERTIEGGNVQIHK